MNTVYGLLGDAAHNPVYAAGVLLAAVIALLYAKHAISRVFTMSGRRAENILTIAAAGLATSVQATGMWKFFGNVLHFSGPLRVLLFAFIEVAVLTSAVRARNNVKEHGTAGVDGIAVWALTGLSAVLASTDASSWSEALFRLSAPLVAAWLWERGLSVERRRRTGKKLHLRFTLERVLVRLGLAEASDRTPTQVDTHRRLTRVTRAAHSLRHLRASGAWAWRQNRAARRLDRAMDAAVEHTSLSSDPAVRDALLEQIALRFHTGALADLMPRTPWADAEERPVLRLTRITRTDDRTDDSDRDRTGDRTGDRTDRRTGRRTESGTGRRTAPRTDGRTDGRTGDRTDRRAGNRTGDREDRRTDTPDEVDRDALVAELTEEIRAAVAAGDKWFPDYPALQERTGRGRSWCEKVVADAKRGLFPADDPERVAALLSMRTPPVIDGPVNGRTYESVGGAS